MELTLTVFAMLNILRNLNILSILSIFDQLNLAILDEILHVL
jgi:hypothetical protein